MNREGDDRSKRITEALLRNLGSICEASRVRAIFVYAEALHGKPLPLPEPFAERVIYVTRTAAEEKAHEHRGATVVRVPGVPQTRLGQAKIAILLAWSRGLVARGEVVACLSGQPGGGALDTLIVTQVGRELELVAAGDGRGPTFGHARPEVVERVIDVASEVSREGREGRAVGALFVIGDTRRVMRRSRQLILNPFRGYPQKERNVLDPSLEETVKAFTTIDGAFVIREDGIIESCGVFLQSGPRPRVQLPAGLGARHHAAAGITADTRAISVTVSESTGTVTVFRAGRILTQLRRPGSVE